MPISALPERTVSALGSSLVLNDARSVVKELVDNALDSKATAVSIEISPNTLDVVQVRDNGTGIDVEDRQLLCKRGCTSKIRSLEDLSQIGGIFLGFRGEALASLTDMSEAVTVTTRVDGEIVASTIKYGASGMLSSGSASHPVGTTVRVQNILKTFPVRQQAALKTANRTLAEIKEMMFAYAFARPKVRFSLKVTKLKGHKSNWTYIPTTSGSLVEVAAKIVGKEVASACTEHVFRPEGLSIDPETSWEFKALFLSGESDKSKLGASQYVSIDDRPVTTQRGTIKEICKMYKRFFQGGSTNSDTSTTSLPFLYLRIRCPPESYDVNIEPSKDEVLFMKPEELLSLTECLFTRVYGEVQQVKDRPRIEETADTAPDRETATPFDLLLARKPTTPSVSSIVPKGTVGSLKLVDPIGTQPNSVAGASGEDARSSVYRSMYSVDLQDIDGLDIDPESHLDYEDSTNVTTEDETSRFTFAKNPFTIAAMNKSVKPTKMGARQDGGSPSTDGPLDGPRDGPSSDSAGEQSQDMNSEVSSGTTPDDVGGRQKLGPTICSRSPMRQQSDDERHGCSSSTEIDQHHPDWSSALATWLTPRSNAIQSRNSVRPGQPEPEACPEVTDRRLSASDSCLLTPPSSHRPSGWSNFQKPFKPPAMKQAPDADKMQQSTLSLTPHSARGAAFPVSDNPSISSTPPAAPAPRLTIKPLHLHQTFSKRSPAEHSGSTNPELDEIMDFEHRKKAAIAFHRRLGAKNHPTTTTARNSDSDKRTVNAGPRPSPPRAPAHEAGDAEDFAARFGTSEPVSRREDPHLVGGHSRWNALVNQPAFRRDMVSADFPSSSSSSSGSQLPRMAEHDPRRYLIRSVQRSGSTLKLARTTSSKLPLEAILPGTETYRLMASVPRPQRADVHSLADHDGYVGAGTNSFVQWGNSALREQLTGWVEEVIRARYSGNDKPGHDVEVSFSPVA